MKTQAPKLTVEQARLAVINAHNDFGNPSQQLSKARAAYNRAVKAAAK